MVISPGLIFLIILCLLVIIIMIFILSSSRKQHPSIFNKIAAENAILRHNITIYEKKIQVIQKIHYILYTYLSDIFQTEDLIQKLTNFDFHDIGISNCYIFLMKNNQLLNTQSSIKETKTLAKLLSSNLIVECLTQNTACTKDTLMFKDLNLLSEINHLLPKTTTYFSIHPIYINQQLIGAILFTASSLPAGDPTLFTEICSILTFHLGYIIYNCHTYKQLLMEHQELKQAVLNRTKELEHAIEKISEISKSKSEIISTVAHEMRTALTSIKGFASLIHQGKLGEISNDAKKRLERIITQVDRLTNMVNTLLDINKIDAGKIEMKPVPINLRSITNQVIDSFLSQLDTKQIMVSISIPENILIIADQIYTERLLSNLISNAIKFTPTSGEISISAKPMKEENKILINISDTGIGIPENELDHIFKDFYHIEYPDITDIKGIGLGLSLVKRIVTAHKGKIWVKSKLGQGTTFFIELPGKLESNHTQRK